MPARNKARHRTGVSPGSARRYWARTTGYFQNGVCLASQLHMRPTAMRVTFRGAFAMSLTAGVGRCSGQSREQSYRTGKG